MMVVLKFNVIGKVFQINYFFVLKEFEMFEIYYVNVNYMYLVYLIGCI